MPNEDELFGWVDSNDIEPLRAALVADPSAISRHDRLLGSTLLIFAAHRGFREIVELLLASGADVGDREGVSDSTALHWAAEGGHVEIARWLIDRGGELELRDAWFALTPLGWASVVDWAPCFREDRPATIALLRERGALVDPFVAIATGDGEALCNLARDRQAFAVRLGFVMREMTPLHFAIARGDVGMTELLVELGAELGATTSRGLGSLALARATGRTELEAILRRAGVVEDASFAIAARDAEALRASLADRKPDPRLLLFAAESGDSTSLRLLLQSGASPEVRVRHLVGEIPASLGPLQLASESGHAEAVRVLLDAGADPNGGRSEREPTPLHLAAGRGHVDCVRILLERGVDRSATEAAFGGTPLGWAIHGSHAAVIELLRDA